MNAKFSWTNTWHISPSLIHIFLLLFRCTWTQVNTVTLPKLPVQITAVIPLRNYWVLNNKILVSFQQETREQGVSLKQYQKRFLYICQKQLERKFMKYSTVSYNQSLSSLKDWGKEIANPGPSQSFWYSLFTKDTAILEFKMTKAFRKKQAKTTINYD